MDIFKWGVFTCIKKVTFFTPNLEIMNVQSEVLKNIDTNHFFCLISGRQDDLPEMFGLAHLFGHGMNDKQERSGLRKHTLQRCGPFNM